MKYCHYKNLLYTFSVTLLFAIALAMNITTNLIIRNFGDCYFTQILLHIQEPIANLKENYLYLSAMKYVVAFPIVCLIFFALVFGVNIFLNKRKRALQVTWMLSLAITLCVLSVVQFIISDSKFHISKSLINFNSTFVEQNFKSVPISQVRFPDKKKNLVLIISESLENTYMRKDLFNENLLENLSRLQGENLTFKQRSQVYGTGWTIAALTSIFYGIPQIPRYSYKTKQQTLTDTYYDIPSIYDYLNANDYRCAYMQGGHIEYTGKNNLFFNRDFIELDHFDTLSESPLYKQNKAPFTWGVNDEILFHHAKEKTMALAASDQPFFLCLLTVDTHAPHGYLPPHHTVETDYFRKVIRMQDKMINDYVDFLKKQSFYKDTVVVILGDHLAMRNDLTDILEEEGIIIHGTSTLETSSRTAYNVFINSEITVKRPADSRYFTSFDLMPTLLHALGAQWGSDQIHMGVSLYGTSNTLLEKYDPMYYCDEMLKNNSFYISLLKKKPKAQKNN